MSSVALQPQFSPRWRVLIPAAVVSLVTMPITAIMFLMLGPLVGFATAVIAALHRDPRRQQGTLSVGASLALGVLAGPAVYLSLALLVALSR